MNRQEIHDWIIENLSIYDIATILNYYYSLQPYYVGDIDSLVGKIKGSHPKSRELYKTKYFKGVPDLGKLKLVFNEFGYTMFTSDINNNEDKVYNIEANFDTRHVVVISYTKATLTLELLDSISEVVIYGKYDNPEKVVADFIKYAF